MDPMEKALDLKAGKAIKLVISVEPAEGDPEQGASYGDPELGEDHALKEEIKNTTDRAPEPEEEEDPDAMMAEMDQIMTEDMAPHERELSLSSEPKTFGARARKDALTRMKK